MNNLIQELADVGPSSFIVFGITWLLLSFLFYFFCFWVKKGASLWAASLVFTILNAMIIVTACILAERQKGILKAANTDAKAAATANNLEQQLAEITRERDLLKQKVALAAGTDKITPLAYLYQLIENTYANKSNTYELLLWLNRVEDKKIELKFTRINSETGLISLEYTQSSKTLFGKKQVKKEDQILISLKGDVLVQVDWATENKTYLEQIKAIFAKTGAEFQQHVFGVIKK